jgi:hypothetical protein
LPEIQQIARDRQPGDGEGRKQIAEVVVHSS